MKRKYNRDTQRLATMRDLMYNVGSEKQTAVTVGGTITKTLERAFIKMVARAKMSPGKMKRKILRMHPKLA